MKNKNSRLDSIKMIISSKEIGSQDELLQELTKEGFQLTQATSVARLEATEGSQSCQHERELCICTSQQYHVQAHDRAAKSQRNAASQTDSSPLNSPTTSL